MHYSLNLDFNFFHPYLPNEFCININEDFRFKKSINAKKITIKAKDEGYESIVTFCNKLNLIESEIIVLEIGKTYESSFYYNNETLKLERIIIKNTISDKTFEEFQINYYSNKIKIDSNIYLIEYKYSNLLVDTITIINKQTNYIDDMFKLIYNDSEEIIKVEEYSQIENSDDDNQLILDKPKLFFNTHVKKKLVNNILEIEHNIEDLIDNTIEKKVYMFNELGLILSEQIYSKSKDKINSQIVYEYEFNNNGDWTKRIAKRKNLAIESNETYKIIEREII